MGMSFVLFLFADQDLLFLPAIVRMFMGESFLQSADQVSGFVIAVVIMGVNVFVCIDSADQVPRLIGAFRSVGMRFKMAGKGPFRPGIGLLLPAGCHSFVTIRGMGMLCPAADRFPDRIIRIGRNRNVAEKHGKHSQHRQNPLIPPNHASPSFPEDLPSEFQTEWYTFPISHFIMYKIGKQ